MTKTLAERFSPLGINILPYLGRAQLREFANTYPTECHLDPIKDVVTFTSAQEMFEIHADMDRDSGTVFRGHVFTLFPKQCVFDTDWQTDFNEMMDLLFAGVRDRQIRLDRLKKAEVVSIASKSYGTYKDASAEVSDLRTLTHSANNSRLNIRRSHLMRALTYYDCNQDVLKKVLPQDLVDLLDKNLVTVPDYDAILVRLCRYFNLPKQR